MHSEHSSDLDFFDICTETPLSSWLSPTHRHKDSTDASDIKQKMKRIIIPRPGEKNVPNAEKNAFDEEPSAGEPVKKEEEKGRRPIILKRRLVFPHVVDVPDGSISALLSDKERNSSTMVSRSVQGNEKGTVLGSSAEYKDRKEFKDDQNNVFLLVNQEHSDSEKSDGFSGQSSGRKKENSIDTSCTTTSISEEISNIVAEAYNGQLRQNSIPGSPIKHRRVREPQTQLDVENLEESGTKARLLIHSTKDHIFQGSINVNTSPISGSHAGKDLCCTSSFNGSNSKMKSEKNGCICDVYTAERREPASKNDMPLSLVSPLHQLKVTTPTRGVSESVDTADTPSPLPVTLIYAGHIQRKKHLKRVSYYILGPLLGEGVFGVVRDAIDTSANHMIPPQFQRVAIKSFKYRRETATEEGVVSVEGEKMPKKVNSESNLKNNLQSLSKAPIQSSRQRYDEKVRRMHDNEVANLQRFHCPNIIRGIDIFTRYGKDYVVLPIAICNLEQLVLENLCHEAFQQHFNNKGVPISSELTIDILSPSYLTVGDSFSNMLRSQGIDDPLGTTFSASLVKGIMYQLLYGILYLHRQGLAHNDLKPQNILLYADGVIKLTDLGSVAAEYNDQGTPMFLSPEVCRYFYGACDAEDMEKDETKVKVSALKNDMWSCGVILYYLLVGRTLWGGKADGRSKYQLYRRIAAQSTAMDLSDVPEPRESEKCEEDEGRNETNNGISTGKKTLSTPFSTSSIRHLLSRLLDVNPNTRISAEEAIQHPSLQLLHKMRDKGTGMIEAAQKGVAQQVLLSPHVRRLIKRDQEQHLQFVAECCSMLDIPLPQEIFLPEQGSAVVSGNEPFLGVSPSQKRNSVGEQRGTVDRRLFPTEDEYNYYEKKLGNSEYDVRSMLKNTGKVKMMYDYLYLTVLVQCGYRNAEEAEKEREEALQRMQKRNELAEANIARLSVLLSPPTSTTATASPVTPPRVSKPNASKQPLKEAEVKRGICSDCLCGLM
ncbi:Protein kinase domain [Trypanosoma melophagium]|uniref:Protein kinase domain n=1 Tax=Trypanosoma melophagium TaxID=715481 RepID=UPI00351A5674|nr:Protein kinase domain [Trypanosoma melophagium]